VFSFSLAIAISVLAAVIPARSQRASTWWTRSASGLRKIMIPISYMHRSLFVRKTTTALPPALASRSWCS